MTELARKMVQQARQCSARREAFVYCLSTYFRDGGRCWKRIQKPLEEAGFDVREDYWQYCTVGVAIPKGARKVRVRLQRDGFAPRRQGFNAIMHFLVEMGVEEIEFVVDYGPEHWQRWALQEASEEWSRIRHAYRRARAVR